MSTRTTVGRTLAAAAFSICFVAAGTSRAQVPTPAPGTAPAMTGAAPAPAPATRSLLAAELARVQEQLGRLQATMGREAAPLPTSKKTPPPKGQASSPAALGVAPAGTTDTPSSLPGYAGASHLYHVGATGFFLDHADRLAFSASQQGQLLRIQQQAQLDDRTAARAIDQAEQELWVLTGADQPDATRVEGKLRDIEKLSVARRLAFVRAVGQATVVLTAEQRAAVLGHAPAATDVPGAGMTPSKPPTGADPRSSAVPVGGTTPPPAGMGDM